MTVSEQGRGAERGLVVNAFSHHAFVANHGAQFSPQFAIVCNPADLVIGEQIGERGEHIACESLVILEFDGMLHKAVTFQAEDVPHPLEAAQIKDH